MKNKNIINVVFRLDGDDGTSAGTGHITRIKKIIKLFNDKKQKFKFFILFKNLNKSKKLFRKNFKDKLIIYDKNFKKKLNFLTTQDLIIVDTPYGIDNTLKKFCETKKLKKVLLIDDENKPKLKNCIIVNGIKYFKKKVIKSKLVKIYQGPKYIILDKKFSKNYANQVSNKILIACGGTDKKNTLFKIVKLVKNFKNIKFYVVIGQMVSKKNPIYKIKSKNIELINKKTDLINYYKKSMACIVAGGIMMFEALSMNKIVYAIKVYNHQKYAIDYLSQRKLVKTIGVNKNIFKNKIINQISKLNKINQKKYKNPIDGKGLFRLEKIFNKHFNI